MISDNETFILSEAKTYNAEKKILSNAPIDNVSVISIDTDNTNENNDIVISSNSSDVDFNGFKIDNVISDKSIYINITTLLYRKNAEELKKKLSSIEKVDIVKIMINGISNYKIIIGPFEDLLKLNQVLKNDTIQEYEDLSIFLK